MIIIKEEDFIGEGGFQKCYAHPNDKNFCIKVITKDINTTRLGYEIKYIKKISKRSFNKIEYPFFSKYYKKIETNIGTGYIYDLVRDEDTGEVSKTMADYLLDETPKFSDETLQQAFDKLLTLMIKHRVIANDLYSNNICCKVLKNGTIEMILIDGLGHKDLIPFAEWFRFLTKQKVERRVLRDHLKDFTKQREMLIKQKLDKNK